MTDYVWPYALAPSAQAYWLQPHVGRSESPFTRQQKIYGLSAPRWNTRLVVRGGYVGEGERGKGAALDSMLVKLAGGLNRALIYDFRRPLPSILIEEFAFDGGETFDGGEIFIDDFVFGTNGAVAAGGTEMTMTGCSPSTLLWRDGDYIGGDGRAHLVTADVISDAAGNAIVPFQPPMAAAVSAGAALLFYVTSPFRLTSDDAGSNPTEVGELQVLDIEFVEDL